MVAGEIKRVQARPRSRRHHERQRLAPHLGHPRLLAERPHPLLQHHRLDTRSMHNPDSWEGWYWGAMHHWGQSARLGGGETYGTVEDCLKNCEMVVFWSTRPGGHQRRLRRPRRHGPPAVAQGAGHPAACTSTPTSTTRPRCWAASGSRRGRAPTAPWRSPSPTSGSPKASTTRSTSPSAPSASRSGRTTSWARRTASPKTPEWQEAETGVPARDVRALAREWGTKKTYLAAGGLVGFGGACRSATGTEWARAMVCLMAMQGLGKPGVNMGCLQQGTPVDTHFFFPGYAEGGFSGDLDGHGAAASTCTSACRSCATVNTGVAGGAAAQDPRGHPGRPLRGLPDRPQDHRGPVPALRVSGAGPLPRSRCTTSTAAPTSAP